MPGPTERLEDPRDVAGGVDDLTHFRGQFAQSQRIEPLFE